MKHPSDGKKVRLIISLKKKQLFKENSESITDIHAGIAMNERIYNLTKENRKEMPAEHKAVMDVINTIARDESEMRDSFRKAGFAEENLPPESRALTRLNVEERLRKGDEAKLWKTSLVHARGREKTPPKKDMH